MTAERTKDYQFSEDRDGEKISVVARDGVLNRMTLYQAARNRAVILCMPAMGVRASYYKPLAIQLALAGWHTVTADLRGHGESGVRVRSGAQFGYRELLELDWPANIAAVKERFPGLPVFLLGHSLGGQLNALFAAQQPETVAGLVSVATGSVYFRGWPGLAGLKILLQTQFLRGISEVVGYLPGDKVGFAGTESKQVIRDWANVAITGYYRPRGARFDYEAGLRNLVLPVLALSFADDELAPPGATRRLMGKMPQVQLDLHELTPAQVGLPSVGHNGWVRNCEGIVPLISSWLEQHC